MNTTQPTTNEFLTEGNLKTLLIWLFPTYNIICDEPLPQIKQKIRPDYRIEELKLIIEFDGVYHYTQPTSCLSDIKNTTIYKELGYNVIRIPYFIQMDSQAIKNLFGEYSKKTIECDFNNYPHGFVNIKNVYPSQYCQLGIERFIKDTIYYSNIIDKLFVKIGETLNDAIMYKQSILSVIPNNTFFNNFLPGFVNYCNHNNIDIPSKIIDEINHIILPNNMFNTDGIESLELNKGPQCQ